MEKKQRTYMQKYWSSLAVVILVCAIILAGNYAEHHFGGYTAHYIMSEQKAPISWIGDECD